MVITKFPFENLTEVLGSECLTGALLDRLAHGVHIIEANGESYSLRQAKKRARSLSNNLYVFRQNGNFEAINGR